MSSGKYASVTVRAAGGSMRWASVWNSAAMGLAALLFSRACFGTDLIGTFVPPYPDGMKEESGACIARSLGRERVCDYSIGLLRTPGGLLFYLGKSAPRVDPKTPRWLIMDQMPFPEKRKGEEVIFGICERNGAIDQTILAVAKTEDAELYTKIRVVYQANLKTERFEEIPTAGIACANEGWGLEPGAGFNPVGGYAKLSPLLMFDPGAISSPLVLHAQFNIDKCFRKT